MQLTCLCFASEDGNFTTLTNRHQKYFHDCGRAEYNFVHCLPSLLLLSQLDIVNDVLQVVCELVDKFVQLDWHSHSFSLLCVGLGARHVEANDYGSCRGSLIDVSLGYWSHT